MPKTKIEKPQQINIHLAKDIIEKIDNDAKKEMRDRKNHIQKILIDYANKLPTS